MKNIYRPMVRPKGGGLEKKVVEEPDLNENPQEEITGLVIGDRKKLKLYDFETQKTETLIKNLQGKVFALGYHSETIWMGMEGFISHWIHSINGKGIFNRPAYVKFFLSHNGVLFDGGNYGLRETISGKVHIKKKDLKNHGIKYLESCFYHNKMLLALVRDNNYHSFFKLNTNGDEISLGDLYLKTLSRENNICSATSVYGKIVSTVPSTHLDVGGYLSEITKLKGSNSQFKSIIFNPSKKEIYASGINICAIKTFKINNGEDNIILESMGDLVSGLSKMVRALLPVTKEQMENIREKAK